MCRCEEWREERKISPSKSSQGGRRLLQHGVVVVIVVFAIVESMPICWHCNPAQIDDDATSTDGLIANAVLAVDSQYR